MVFYKLGNLDFVVQFINGTQFAPVFLKLLHNYVINSPICAHEHKHTFLFDRNESDRNQAHSVLIAQLMLCCEIH